MAISQNDDRTSHDCYKSWNGPRTVIVPRTHRGFGFTLRHFIVYPPEPSVRDRYSTKEREYTCDNDPEELYFQRVQHGNLDPMDTIFVKNVRDGGPAYQAGLNPGDRIISVNGEPVTGKSYGQVINLIQQSNSDLNLLVVPKDEDILQLAYQNSSQTFDSDYGLGDSVSSSVSGRGLRVPAYPPYDQTPSMENITYPSTNPGRDRNKISSSTSSLDSRNTECTDSSGYYGDRELPRKLSTSTSYTSGLSFFRDPLKEENMNKATFLDRKKEFEARAAQENVNPNTSKTFSFGLYYPTPTKKDSHGVSLENVPRPMVIRRSRETVLQPTDSQENITKCRPPRTRNVPVEYRHSGTPDQKVVDRFRSQETLGYEPESRPHSRSPHGSGSTVRHSFPDSGAQMSWTSPNRRSSETSSPYGAEHVTPTHENTNNKRESYTSSRQYVPVINQSSSAGVSPSQKMSASVDSIDPRSNIFYTEQYLRSSYNSRPPEQQNQPSSSRTFIVKIADGQADGNNKRSSTPNISQQAGSHYGAAFALTRSPAPTEIEIRKNEPRILVSHRKKQFENDNTSPLSNGNNTRFKNEIEKIASFRKYDGVGSRIATFEKQNSSDSIPRSRSQTPVGQQPNSKVRRMSQERVKSPELSQNTQHTQGNSQSNYSDSAPIRIYVSQGTSNTSGSPIVEIVPMPSNYDHSDGGRGSHHSEAIEAGDPDFPQKPVRKASFLSAVNAPYSRYLPQTGYDHEIPATESTAPKPSRSAHAASHTHSRASANQTPIRATANQTSANFATNQSLRQLVNQTPTQFSTNQNAVSRPSANQTPTNFVWAGHSPSSSLNAISPSVSNTSIGSVATSGHDVSGVRLRNKPEMSAEDLETKLHRRTSYLMATSTERSAVNLTMSPTSMSLDPETPMMSKHKSMRKLKDFFGEKTPKIVEAQEKRQDPASPILQVMKEGSLGCKVDVLDGKRASDRSWRPVWAVLRGHALYLCKDKREAGNFVAHALSVKHRGGSQQTNVFSYEEQPISVKSCIVDIAHGYTKKKNVFRLKAYNGSEYLFQADDHESMLTWIAAIKDNNNPDEDAQGVTSSELIIRKSQELEPVAPATKVSPPTSQKMTKKLSVLSIKPKMPHSPSLKRRKTTTDKDETGKPKTWKGKIGKSFRKQFGSSPTTNIHTVPETGGMFGVPLECCTPSPNNEFVPLLVDLCIQIVEAKGLEMTGVYRVPGNKLAVTNLQAEFNKGLEAMNLDHEKWSDVNVISSLLKSFFRQLPEPLITDELYQPLIDASRIDDPERRMLKLKRLIHELPEHHFETFKHLAKHLNKVALYGDVNRMQAKNLAIVFGPTLICKADDNMAAMVTDMSDHCKIIESIVLHCDWFFGSWDMDNYVPTDDDATECTSITSALTGSTREDLDNISINPREIVTSIVEAANRKLRGDNEEQLSMSPPDPSPRYNERNIDQEIVLRTRKIDNTCRSSPNLTAMQRSNEILNVNADVPSDRRMAKSQDFCDRDFPEFDYMDSEKESLFLVPGSRYFSDDVLDRNDELEFSHSSQNGNYRLSRETLDSLRRIEMEARALREREERRQRDHEKRKLEKQRIEQDILQTQHELEIEERHSVEDLLNAPDYSQWGVSPDSYKRKLETSAIRDPTVTHDHGGTISARDSLNGGKYFVVKGNNAQTSRPPRQSSVESLAMTSKRTGSLENMTDARSRVRGHSRPLAHVRGARKGDSDKSKRDSAEISRKSLARSSSVRRGSLDSLIDLIEKRDSRMSWASTDSDEGLDLLTTLTSQFDQKLQTFSSPKLPTAPPPTIPRRVPTASNSQTNISLNSSDVSDTQPQSAQRRLPPQPPLSLVHRNGGSSSDLSGKPYRDPSLHRTPPKPDAKVGLATRFERTTTHNPTYQGSVEAVANLSRGNFMNLTSDVVYTVNNVGERPSDSGGDSRSVEPRGDTQVSSVMVVTPSPSVMSADSRQNSGYLASHFVSPPVVSTATKWEGHQSQSPSRTEYRPISKFEKTEANVKLSQTGSKVKSIMKNVSESAIDNHQISALAGKSRSESPTLANRRKVEKRKKRRHTVGGTNDHEHYRALEEAVQGSSGRLSAWEQLRPAVSSVSNIGPNSSMLTWLRNERLRGSTPDLLSIGDATTDKQN